MKDVLGKKGLFSLWAMVPFSKQGIFVQGTTHFYNGHGIFMAGVVSLLTFVFVSEKSSQRPRTVHGG